MHKSEFALRQSRAICSFVRFCSFLLYMFRASHRTRVKKKNGFRLFLEHIIARVSDVDDDYYDYYFVWFLSFSFYFSIWLALTCLPRECMRTVHIITTLTHSTPFHRNVNCELSQHVHIYHRIKTMSRCMVCMSARFIYFHLILDCMLLNATPWSTNLTMAHFHTFRMPCICDLRNIKNYEKKYSLFLFLSLAPFLFVLFRPIYMKRGSEHRKMNWKYTLRVEKKARQAFWIARWIIIAWHSKSVNNVIQELPSLHYAR